MCPKFDHTANLSYFLHVPPIASNTTKQCTLFTPIEPLVNYIFAAPMYILHSLVIGSTYGWHLQRAVCFERLPHISQVLTLLRKLQEGEGPERGRDDVIERGPEEGEQHVRRDDVIYCTAAEKVPSSCVLEMAGFVRRPAIDALEISLQQ